METEPKLPSGYYVMCPSTGSKAPFDTVIADADATRAAFDQVKESMARYNRYQVNLYHPGLLMVTRHRKLVNAGLSWSVRELENHIRLVTDPAFVKAVTIDIATVRLSGNASGTLTRTFYQSLQWAYLQVDSGSLKWLVRYSQLWSVYALKL